MNPPSLKRWSATGTDQGKDADDEGDEDGGADDD
jgi:hypothetical protein